MFAPSTVMAASVSLGPGQRFLTKGGYVLPIRDGRPNAEGALWILS
ncbi:MAG: hypothetical protein QNL90_09025 [Gammaproteobacteria bacterium]|nr:hypothetical protein [Gammaproteobacteria bacterium]